MLGFCPGIFYGFGGVRATLDDQIIQGDQLQIILPPDGQPQANPQLLAQGSVAIQGTGFSLTANRLESSQDGQSIFFSGDVFLIFDQGNIRAGLVQFNTQTQEFFLDQDAALFTPVQEFLSHDP